MLARPEAAEVRTWRAPGRVNLIGDHTDYQDGYCLPMAVDRECRVSVAPATSAGVRARSAQIPGAVAVAADGGTEPAAVAPPWGRFVAGAVAACVAAGARVDPCDLEITSTVPAGSGMSSSSALAVALVIAFADRAGLDLDRTALARLALDAEVRATGVPGGLMDQMAALHAEAGHVLLLDCRTLTVDPILLPRSLGVVVVHSGRARTLAGSAYAQRRAEVEAVAARLGVPTLRDATRPQVRDDPRARHVVTENARVLAFADALRAGRTGELGPLLLESHASLRDDFGVSTPELDRAVALLMEHGALGARLTGAGFGGCVVGLVQRNHADDVLARVARALVTAGVPQPLAFAVRPGTPAGEVSPGGTPVA
ncbi:MAG: galactokinase family protein [Acidimicrobiia bacterium]|jgi:galactokinase